MPALQRKQDYVDFIAARVPTMSVAALKRVVRCIHEETTGKNKPKPANTGCPPPARVRFEDEQAAQGAIGERKNII
jgi:hypothetical protein